MNYPNLDSDDRQGYEALWGDTSPAPVEPENLGLGAQPTRPFTEPLATEPGDLPQDMEAPEGVYPDAPFHQYLIAVGATGEPNKEKLAKAFHDAGMVFAQAVGVEPILATGYVSESAHPADYLAAAKVWHNHLPESTHRALRDEMPKFYAALSILFGTRRLDV